MTSSIAKDAENGMPHRNYEKCSLESKKKSSQSIKTLVGVDEHTKV